MKQHILIEKSGYKCKLVDTLTKVFSTEEPADADCYEELQAFRGESISFQVSMTAGRTHSDTADDYPLFRFVKVALDSPIADYITVRAVEDVPCHYPAHYDADQNYLATKPGLYPDLLTDLFEDMVMVTPGYWKTLWLEVRVPETALPGTYPVKLVFTEKQDHVPVATVETEITILEPVLPKLTLPRTEWFYVDCLSDYYHVPVYSEEHWRIMENFLRTAVNYGITMILTPQFTPPLDTAVGRERTTTQLVDVVKDGDSYSFGFDRLERWVNLCKRCGVQYYEMSHLFSQWGAVAAPKVVGMVNGKEERLFGWDTPAVGGEYTRFLRQYLPALTAKLQEWGIADCCYFHISDEPHLSQLESYRAARDSVIDLLKGYHLMDALSDYEFYRTGAVEIPICATNHIKPYLENKVENLWSYYCTAQGVDVSNRFIAMPAGRTRIYGTQMYKYNIRGTLHWGYNFYNSVDSLWALNPYTRTDSAGSFPSGDPFLVYPKADGTPEISIRLVLMEQAMNDFRALHHLESLIGRKQVLALVEETLTQPLEFDRYPAYPQDKEYLFRLRYRVNQAICRAVKT